MKRISLIILIISVIFSSCKNGDWEFPDYEYSAAYFAYQTPVRIITLGTDYVNDNTLDNQKQCQIMATAQGFYEVKNDIVINFVVDESLCDILDFPIPMPSNYYSLSDNKMTIPKGSKTIGGVTVTLTDDFFADPLALTNHYVIPIRMTTATGVDRILTGTPAEGVDNPNRLNPDHWDVLPKDYTLYAVKYLNQWDATYLRRGTDNITTDGTMESVERKSAYSPVQDEVIKLNSISLNSLEFAVTNIREGGTSLDMSFKLDFDAQNCTFANGAWKDGLLVDEYTKDKIRVFDITVSGSGQYIKDSNDRENRWADRDRDVLNLNYAVSFKVEPESGPIKEVSVVTSDILVLRDRGVALETIEPVLK